MSEEKSILIVNEKVYRLIDEAIERTKSNKRSTVRASDF